MTLPQSPNFWTPSFPPTPGKPILKHYFHDYLGRYVAFYCTFSAFLRILKGEFGQIGDKIKNYKAIAMSQCCAGAAFKKGFIDKILSFFR